jgi:hypothetical protein
MGARLSDEVPGIIPQDPASLCLEVDGAVLRASRCGGMHLIRDPDEVGAASSQVKDFPVSWQADPARFFPLVLAGTMPAEHSHVVAHEGIRGDTVIRSEF